MAKSLISMLEIADVICEDYGDVTKRHRASVIRHLATCYRKIQMFVNNDTNISTAVLSAGNVIELPKDFIYETKVGIKYEDRIVLLSKKWDDTGSRLLNVNQSGCRRYIESVLHHKSYSDVCTPFYNSKGEILLAYGPGVKCEGVYSLDKQNGRIELGSEFPKGCDIVVEYVSDGISVGQKMVPIEMYDCLYNYGAMKLYFQRGDSRWRQSAQDYDEAYYQLEMLYKFVPIDYIVSLFQQETHTINNRI